ncbi:hypothetical protein [Nonomuraea sp. NPDC049750]|uniref:hypothetical protein n=1 Tax=Nonomuraea sp. NPDC049750 TaxID=3154738 RepID=UPI00340D0891
MFNRIGGAVDKYVLLFVLIAVMGAAAYAVHRFVERPLAPALKRLMAPRRQPTKVASSFGMAS